MFLKRETCSHRLTRSSHAPLQASASKRSAPSSSEAKKSLWMTSSSRFRTATSRISTSSSRPMCRVLWKLWQTPCSHSIRTTKCASISCIPASVPSMSPMSCSPLPPTRSSSHSTCVLTPTPVVWRMRKASISVHIASFTMR